MSEQSRRDLAQLLVPVVRWSAEQKYAEVRPLIEEALALGVGGFQFVGGEQDGVRALAKELQTKSRHPLLIAADLERKIAIVHAEEEPDLEAVFDVPVQVSAVLGKASMEVSQLLKLGTGAVLELDRKVGEAIDIYVNNRLVARGEVVVIEDRLGVTMTEIIKVER